MAVAPLATGHPLGLPATQERTSPATRVQPAAREAAADNNPGTGGQPPGAARRDASGDPDPEPHSAPPSIMQIKITAMLEEQAEALRGTAPDTAETQPGDARASPG
ncbi:hypothetical protein [Salipiger mucosus]|uniref:Uncharacterized protein n=1 Tax=Salipiger mucosus DSM 16094 TaxID=1123237 RepID=S9QW87_9RHOB|nr:hypothetical protein [Salipiger mucosus]EPX85611.1 hypothetical protein Salmuc_04882 [Salipiger mucosus DSM 16094]